MTTKQQFKLERHNARLAARKGRKVALLKLVGDVRRACAGELAALRERDDFFASGKSLVGYMVEKTSGQPIPAWARLQPEPLPVGLPMPPNVCHNPAFIV